MAYQEAGCEGKEVVQGAQCLLNKHVDLVGSLAPKERKRKPGLAANTCNPSL